MMMSRNSVTSYFGKRFKGWYSIHSHQHKSGGNFTKVIELHKTKISEGRIRPKKDLTKQWKGRRCHLPPAPTIWDEDSPDQLCLRRAQAPVGTAAALLSHTPRQLCSEGKKRWRVGIRDKPSRWGHPKGSHREDQVLEFYWDASSPGSGPGQGLTSCQDQQSQGCSEPVCLTRQLTHRLRWISWRYCLFLTLVPSPWQTQTPSAEGHWLLLALGPNSFYSVQGIETSFSSVCYHRLLIHII